MARAFGSYPKCQEFKSLLRYQVLFRTKVNRFIIMHGRLAQLGEHLPYKQGVTGSSPVSSTMHGPVVQLV